MTGSGAVRRSPAGNVLSKWVIEGSGRIFNVLLAVIGARWLGPEAWGHYWTGFGIAQIAATGSDLGGHVTLTRQLAAQPRGSTAWLSAGLVVKASLMLAASITGIAFMLQAHFEPALTMALIATAILVSANEWLGAWLRGLGRVREEAIALAGLAVLGCALGLVMLSRSATTPALAVSQLVAAVIAVLGTTAYLFARVGFRLDPRWRAALPLFWSRAWPVGLSIVISILSWKLLYVFLASSHRSLWTMIGPDRSHITWEIGGHYGAAHRLLEAARFLPAAAASALLPSLAAARRPLNPMTALRWLVPLAAVPALAGLVPGLSSTVMAGVFGPAYAGDGALLSVFLLALPAMTVTGVLTHWIISIGRERLLIPLMSLHLALHLIGLVIFPAVMLPDSSRMLPALNDPGLVPWALALVVAEAGVCAGTLIVWRRLK